MGLHFHGVINVDVGWGFRGGELGDFHDSVAAPFE
jgi:hypothetical protein